MCGGPGRSGAEMFLNLSTAFGLHPRQLGGLSCYPGLNRVGGGDRRWGIWIRYTGCALALVGDAHRALKFPLSEARNLMGQSLSKKRALVTGGSRGIGAAIVRRLAADGADVALTYVSRPENAHKTVEAAQEFDVRALAIQADAADPAAVVAAVEHAADVFGGIDILVNNAGIAVISPVDALTLEDFDRTYEVNVRSVFVATQAVLKHMPDGGRIINIGSCNAERMPFVGGAAYAMSKAALKGLAQGLARDLGPRAITVNNVQPGPVDTEMNPADGELAGMLKGLMALPRYAHVDEIAAMVAYLAGPEAGFVTGASLTIDGGFTA
jgi:3-oxoacyl-[acyl-carrier protein] reductase